MNHIEVALGESLQKNTVVHRQRPWIVIVEPDVDARLLVVVTPYEVSQ